jgi:general L-amino acid transport system permease protein
MSDSALAPPVPPLTERLRRAYFSTPLDGFLTVLAVGSLSVLAYFLLTWVFLDSTWGAENFDRCAGSDGACWSAVSIRMKLILFGLYPQAEIWRSALACFIVVLSVGLSCHPSMWAPLRMMGLWLGGYIIFLILMAGGIPGLPAVPLTSWGGLSVTLMIYVSVIALGLPMSLAITLIRRSRFPVFRVITGVIVDLTRSLPLLTIMFAAAVVLPFVLPQVLVGDKLPRVILAFAFFFACYQSEILRGGFQALSHGQVEASQALGLNGWQTVFLVQLPQVFRNTMPATINQFVISFKETSLVVIIGVFDLLAATDAAFLPAEYSPYYKEIYLFTAAIYFVFAFSLSQYGRYLERTISWGRQ